MTSRRAPWEEAKAPQRPLPSRRAHRLAWERQRLSGPPAAPGGFETDAKPEPKRRGRDDSGQHDEEDADVPDLLGQPIRADAERDHDGQHDCRRDLAENVPKKALSMRPRLPRAESRNNGLPEGFASRWERIRC
jgi:hypothetical protein